MKAYLATTGATFILITVAHLLRMVREPQFARDPWYLLLTVATAALSVWAARLFLARSANHVKKAPSAPTSPQT